MADVQHSALTGANLHEPKGIAAATPDSIIVADGAGGSSIKVAASLPYAGITLSGNATATTIGTINTYYLVAGTWVESQQNRLTTTLASGRIQNPTTNSNGVYMLHADVSMIASRNGVVAAFKFAKNGVVEGVPLARNEIGVGVDVETCSFSAIKEGVSQNDYYQIFVTLTGDGAGLDGDTVTVTESTFTMHLIGT
jgi:hypothetical protein